MKVVAIITDLFENPDSPVKSLTSINSKPLIIQTYKSVVATGLFSDVVVYTSNLQVVDEIKKIQGNALATTKNFDNSFEACAEIAIMNDADLFVCFQANHFMADKSSLAKMLEVFDGVYSKDVKVASIIKKINDDHRVNDNNVVKVVVGLRMNALYFSRYPVPYIKSREIGFSHYEHVNIVACRKEVLLNILSLPSSPLERAENIDCLRLVENGINIKMVMTNYPVSDINTMADLAAAELSLSK